MKAVVTVTGTDQRGIIAKVSGYLFEHGVNIEDITQTILGGQFAMMMKVDLSESKEDISQLADGLEKTGRDIGVSVRIQHVDIFDAMHNV